LLPPTLCARTLKAVIIRSLPLMSLDWYSIMAIIARY
jgi:hypothetical protein